MRRLANLDPSKVRGGDRIIFIDLFSKFRLGKVVRRVKDGIEVVDAAKNRYGLDVEDVLFRLRKSSWGKLPKELR